MGVVYMFVLKDKNEKTSVYHVQVLGPGDLLQLRYYANSRLICITSIEFMHNAM